MTDEQLYALLRLKRYEQPPPQYFDGLLKDIHRRQRTELLRRPLWKIAAERVQTFFGEHSMGHLSYAGAMAAVLVVGVTAIGVMTSEKPAGTGSFATENENEPAPFTQIAANPRGKKTVQPERVAANTATAPSTPDRLLSIETASGPQGFGSQLPRVQPGFVPAGLQPRYVIDARPVSYEPSSAFNF